AGGGSAAATTSSSRTPRTHRDRHSSCRPAQRANPRAILSPRSNAVSTSRDSSRIVPILPPSGNVPAPHTDAPPPVRHDGPAPAPPQAPDHAPPARRTAGTRERPAAEAVGGIAPPRAAEPIAPPRNEPTSCSHYGYDSHSFNGNHLLLSIFQRRSTGDTAAPRPETDVAGPAPGGTGESGHSVLELGGLLQHARPPRLVALAHAI